MFKCALSVICPNFVCEGYISLCKFAHENGCSLPTDFCNLAVEGGSLDCIKYAEENGYVISSTSGLVTRVRTGRARISAPLSYIIPNCGGLKNGFQVSAIVSSMFCIILRFYVDLCKISF